MTDIKLICLDMDGTLLGADHATVPARNVRALRAASERGTAVAVASGRPWGFLHEVAEQLGVLRYAVLSNGAAVLDVCTGEWLYRNCLPEETRQALTELLLEEGVPFEVYCEGESWIQRDRLEGVLAHTFSPEFQRVLQEHARFPADLNAALRGRLVEKIHVFHVPPEGRKSLMERAAACGALEMVTSFAENLEFTAAGVNKGTAVQALCDRLGLGPEQVMAWNCWPGRGGPLPWLTPRRRPSRPPAMRPAPTRRAASAWRWSAGSWRNKSETAHGLLPCAVLPGGGEAQSSGLASGIPSLSPLASRRTRRK